MRKAFFNLFILLGLVLGSTTLVTAQSEDYSLTIHRSFGFSSGSQIRGLFSLEVRPSNIQAVTYLIDGQVMARVTISPFSYSFQTTQYSIGWHQLSAEIETLDGRKVTTLPKRFEFATPEQESSAVVNILVPIIGGLLVVTAIILGFQFLIGRKRPRAQLSLGTARNYGFNGGGVCPRCHRPFPLHWWAPNLGFSTKFDRCDFCGKWAIVRRLNSSELATAEASELQMAQPETPITAKSDEERLREMVDNSRYTHS